MKFFWEYDCSAATFLYFVGYIANVVLCSEESSVWSDWWSYDGISGPDYWGLLNSDWRLCSRGRYQSPVNIQPQNLVFDPSLSTLHIDKKEVRVIIANTGHDISIKISRDDYIGIYGGPLAYKYRLYEVKVHFGSDNSKGSEHLVAGNSFAVEIQFMAFNEDLYSNISMALNSPHGLAAIAVLTQINYVLNIEIDALFEAFKSIQYKGDETSLDSISLISLLPDTPFYMTYDGSLTFPPCHEVVTWIVMNRPIIIGQEQVQILRALHQGDKNTHKVLMMNNYRTTVPLKNRTVRTNIKSPETKEEECVTKRQTKYEESLVTVSCQSQEGSTPHGVFKQYAFSKQFHCGPQRYLYADRWKIPSVERTMSQAIHVVFNGGRTACKDAVDVNRFMYQRFCYANWCPWCQFRCTL